MHDSLWPMDYSMLGSSVFHNLLEFAQIRVYLSRWCYLTISSSSTPFSSCPQSFQHQSFPMSRLFTSGGQSIGAFSFSISPSIQYSGLIFFRIDWFDLLVVQGILMSLLQHHSSKASILQHSAFFMVQLSHTYMTTRKTIALTILALCTSLIELA